MRINKACLLLATSFMAVALGQAQVSAMSPETLNGNVDRSKRAVVKTKAASKIQEVDNSGRKLAVSIPGLGTANISLTPEVKPTSIIGVGKSSQSGKSLSKSAPSYPYAVSRTGNNITVKVPETVDEAFDYAHVAAKQVGKLANEGGTQFSNFTKWIGIYIKQLSHTATVTPAGYPYMAAKVVPPPTQIAAGQKLYLTTEGRLKTVVQR